MRIEYTFKEAREFPGIGNLVPGDVRDLPREKAEALISNGYAKAAALTKQAEKPKDKEA